jgi:undecaprenyl-diphosphatase
LKALFSAGKICSIIDGGENKPYMAETETPPVQRYHSLLFRLTLWIVTFAFLLLTFLVYTVGSFSFDLQVTHALQSINFPGFAGWMAMISWVGYDPQSIVIAGLIGLALYYFNYLWETVIAWGAAFFSSLSNLLIKELIHRPRPASDLVRIAQNLDSYSFPSGHVMFYTIFFGFIFFLGFTLLKPSWKRTLLLLTLGSLILLVGISRIYLGEHWVSDVIGGYLLSIPMLAGSIWIYRHPNKEIVLFLASIANQK